MLSCREVSRLASDYLNRDLPLRRRIAVRLHLMMCEGCTRYIAQMRAAIALLRQMGQSAPDADPAHTGAPDDEHARALFRSSRKR